MEDLIVNDNDMVKLSTDDLHKIILGLAELPAKHSFHLIMRLEKIVAKRRKFGQGEEQT